MDQTKHCKVQCTLYLGGIIIRAIGKAIFDNARAGPYIDFISVYVHLIYKLFAEMTLFIIKSNFDHTSSALIHNRNLLHAKCSDL